MLYLRKGYTNKEVWSMAYRNAVRPTIPASNMERARACYAEKLGLEPEIKTASGELLYRCKDSWLNLYPSQYAGTAQNTAAEFEKGNLERDMQEMRSKGNILALSQMGNPPEWR